MANDNAKPPKETLMKAFCIDTENSVVAYGAREVPPAAMAFSSEAELAAISASWPSKRFVDIWNRLPRVTAVTKFTDRKTAVRRIWQATSGLEATRSATAARARKPAERKTGAKAKPPQTQQAGTKTERIIALLKRPEGATLKAIMSATGWQPHSVRGFVSAQLTKRMGLKVKSFKRQGERVYKIRPD